LGGEQLSDDTLVEAIRPLLGDPPQRLREVLLHQEITDLPAGFAAVLAVHAPEFGEVRVGRDDAVERSRESGVGGESFVREANGWGEQFLPGELAEALISEGEAAHSTGRADE